MPRWLDLRFPCGASQWFRRQLQQPHGCWSDRNGGKSGAGTWSQRNAGDNCGAFRYGFRTEPIRVGHCNSGSVDRPPRRSHLLAGTNRGSRAMHERHQPERYSVARQTETLAATGARASTAHFQSLSQSEDEHVISRGGLLFAILLLALAPPTVVARQRDAKGSFPFRLLTNFDYAE